MPDALTVDALASCTITLSIDNVHFADLMTDFMELGYSDWLHSAVAAEAYSEWYADPNYYLGRDDFWFTANVETTNDGSTVEPYKFNRESLAKGWDLLAREYPVLMRRLMSEDYDVDDVDTLMQLCMFGEIIYG